MKAPRRIATRWASISLMFISPLAWPADLTIPNTFVSGTPASAADVNANFSATQSAVNSKQDRVIGTCPPGQSIRAVNQDGSVLCQLLSFFGGDGSAGNLTVAAGQNWNSSPPLNPNFADITINAGQTLLVPAGTIIRCSGTFTNNGTLSVLAGAENSNQGGFFFAGPSGGPYSYAHPGDTRRMAAAGQWDNNMIAVPGTNLQGGAGGNSIPQVIARTSFAYFRLGGGAGAGSFQSFPGGGLVKIYCEGPIVNAGTISAVGSNASNGHGGGGGGIVILASRTAVSNSGSINVNGGNGGSSTNYAGNGGGGGGGIVIMASPTAPVLGTVSLAGGAEGTGAGALTTQSRHAGGGGGGSGGAGGTGGNVSGATPAAAGAGAAGYSVAMTLDPLTIER